MSEIDAPPPSENRQNAPDTQEENAAPLTDRTCLLVLGMHRSGTSALTRLLSLAGARLPLRLMPAGPGNESGHWEPLHLVEYHDKMLESLGSSWHDWRAVDFLAAKPKLIQDAKSSIKTLIQEDYADGGIYAVKDPRICRFAEFFIETIEETGDKVALVHAFRSPLDVVNSLNSRKVVWPQGYTTTDAALLWLRHVLDAEAACRERKRALISFDSLMADPKEALARIARQTGLTFEKSWNDIEPEVRTFLSPNQRHHAFSVRDLDLNPDTRGWVETVFLALRDLEADPQDVSAAAKIVGVAERFNEACPVLARLRANVELSAAQKLSEKIAEIAKLNLQLEETSKRRANADAETDIASLTARLAEAESHKHALSEALNEAQRVLDSQRLAMLQHEHELKVQLDLKSQEILHLQRQITDTHLAYTMSTSWKVTRPLRAVAESRNALRRATHARFAPRAPVAAGATEPNALGAPARADHVASPIAPDFTPSHQPYAPLVSVIVPNAGGATHLKRRLSSIYAQDYRNFEVILLDDRAPEGNGGMMRFYRDRFAGNTTLIENSERQGARLWQWQMGLSVAKGDLVWITDANDWNEPDFLSNLIPALRDESILLAYSNTIFMTEDGSGARSTLSEQFRDLDAHLWREDFTLTAHQLVSGIWSKTNIVPTPSSALVRRPAGTLKAASDSVADGWASMTQCGDWLFYLDAAKGGRVHFTSGVNTFCHFVDQDRKNSDTSAPGGQRERDAIANYCSKVYNTKAAESRAGAAKRMPSILMVGRAFTANAQDTLPILLANMLRREGYAVTFLCCHREPAQQGVRELLNTDIPLLNDPTPLNGIVTDYGIDIVHTHHPDIDQDILRELQAQKSCARAITIHGGGYSVLQPDKRETAIRYLEQHADAVIYTSPKGVQLFREAGLQDSDKLHRIADALEDVPFEPVPRARLNIPLAAFVLCLKTPATPAKGWAESILAVRLARERSNLDIHLLLAGSGAEAERLRALHGESEFIHFLGAHKNMRDYYATSDMGLMPSRDPEESYPLNVIECLSTGTPVLAAANGDVPDMLAANGELAGCLLDFADRSISIESLANKIILCAADRGYYARMKAAAALAYAKFDPRDMLSLYTNVYRSIVRP